MSIATDEAAKKYPAPTDADDPMYKYVEAIAGSPSAKRQGYVAGRTAEPTEEEVKAVADEVAAWNFDVAMNSGATIHAAAADFSSRSFELLAKRVLTAARKTVTESREVEGNENGEI